MLPYRARNQRRVRGPAAAALLAALASACTTTPALRSPRDPAPDSLGAAPRVGSVVIAGSAMVVAASVRPLRAASRVARVVARVRIPRAAEPLPPLSSLGPRDMASRIFSPVVAECRARHPKGAGKLDLGITVAPTGQVLNSDAFTTSPPLAPLAECVQIGRAHV